MDLCENFHIHEAIEPRASINLSVYPLSQNLMINPKYGNICRILDFAQLKFVIVINLNTLVNDHR